MAVTKTTGKKSELIIANIIQTSADRTRSTIGDYKNAVVNAESIYYPNRASLYDLYTRVSIDGVLTGSWELKRVAQVLSKVLKFKRDGKEIEGLDQLITSKKFRDFVKLILQQKAWGLQGAEFKVGPVFDWANVPVKHINPVLKKITKWQYGEEGWDYEDHPNIIVLGNKDDYGFLLKITPIILYKQGNWGDWADFVEKYGSPFQIYEYDLYDEGSKQQAFDLARNAGSNLAIVLPKQLAFRTEDGKQVNGDGKLQGNFNDALNKEITLTVLGNLETTNGGGGSYAKAKVQSLDQSNVIAMDMMDVLDVLNSTQFLSILESYGHKTAGGLFEYEIVADPEELKAEIEIDKFLIMDAKLPISDDYFYEKYGRPKPDNYDELKAQQEASIPVIPPPHNEEDAATHEDILPPKQKKKKAQNKKQAPEQKLSFWDKIDLRIANFFAPGHKG